MGVIALSATGLPRDMFPAMTTPAHQEGTLSNRAAEQTGFAPGTSVCPVGGDQQCAIVDAGIVMGFYLGCKLW